LIILLRIAMGLLRLRTKCNAPSKQALGQPKQDKSHLVEQDMQKIGHVTKQHHAAVSALARLSVGWHTSIMKPVLQKVKQAKHSCTSAS
jgi:hypothetical protein